MGVISTGLTEIGVRAAFFAGFDGASDHYKQLCTRIPSTTAEEKYRFLGNVPRMREWGPGRQLQGLMSESYDVASLRYEVSLEVDADEVADDQTGQSMTRIRELGQVAGSHKDYQIAQLLINGNAAGFVGYDGVPFFSASHVSDQSGTQDNTIAPTATDPDDPTVAEFKKALTQAIQRLMSFKNDKGNSMRSTPDGLSLIVPGSMFFTALEVVGATMISSSDNVLKNSAAVVPLPEIDDANVFYLLKTNVELRPLIFQDREAIRLDQVGAGSELHFSKNKFWYGATARYRITYGRWQYAIRAEFEAA